MKKLNILLIMVLIGTMITTVLSADTTQTTVTAYIDEAIQSSPQLLRLTNLNESLWKNYLAAYDRSNQINNYINLYNKDDKTFEETEELKILVSIYGDFSNPDIKSSLLLSRDITPLEIADSIESNRQTITNLKNSIEYNVKACMIDVQKKSDAVTLKKASINNLEKNLKQAKLKLLAGKLSNLQYKQLGGSYKIALSELNKLKLSENIAIYNAKKILGKNYEKAFSIKELISEKVEVEHLEKYIKDALNNRNDIVNTKRSYDIKNKKYELLKSVYKAEDHPKVSEASLSTRSAQYAYNTLLIDVESQITELYKSYEAQQLEVTRVQSLLEIAQYKYSETEKKYRLGLATELDLSNTDTELTKYKLQYSSSKKDLYLIQLKLDQARK